MLDSILKLRLSNCLHCGSFSARRSLLCGQCEEMLFRFAFNAPPVKTEIRSVPIMTFFQWQRDRNRILNRLSLALKGSGQREAWRYYAEKLIMEWSKTENFKSSSVLVPCPSKDGHADHASLFANALSEQTGIPVKALLVQVNAKEQKGLTRREREQSLENRFELAIGKDEKFSQVYFVDDIVTSGSTVAAAYYHLKNLGRVKAISLIIRE